MANINNKKQVEGGLDQRLDNTSSTTQTQSRFRKLGEKLFSTAKPDSPTLDKSLDSWITPEKHCRSLLLEALSESDPYQRLQILKLTGTNAQNVIDFIALLFLPGNGMTMESVEGRRALELLRDLAASANSGPQCYKLEGIKNIKKVKQSNAVGNSEIIYSGYHGKKENRVKVFMYPCTKARIRDLILRANLSHANIAPFYGLCDLSETLYIVSPEAGNTTLHEYIHSIAQPDRLPLIRNVLDGACYLHRLDIVHGDLKGVNVLISDTGRAMIANFTSPNIVAPGMLIHESHSGSLSPRWAAPEELHRRLDERASNVSIASRKASDVWSLGCLMYEVLTRKEPFYEYEEDAVVTIAITKRRLPSQRPDPKLINHVDEVDDLTWDVMTPCWHHIPDFRPTCEALRASFHGLGSPHQPPEATTLDDQLPRKDAGASAEVRIDFSSLFNLLGGDRRAKIMIGEIMADSDKRRQILDLRGTPAQEMVDFLSEVVSAGDTRTDQLNLLRDLAASSLKFPQIGEIKDPIPYHRSEGLVRGEFGRVYKKVYNGRHLCLKVISKPSDGRIQSCLFKELTTWLHLRHPHILPLYAVCWGNGKQNIQLFYPYMPNGNLRDYLKNAAHCSDLERMTLLCDTVNGLAYLHQFGIVHADLHAGNVLVSKEKRAMITDLGLSETSLLTATITSNPRNQVKIHTMAPELVLQSEDVPVNEINAIFDISGGRHRNAHSSHEGGACAISSQVCLPTRASDVWSLGCLLYETFFGQPPYHPATLPQIVLKFMHGVAPARPAGAVELLWVLVSPCLDFDPKKRPTCEKLQREMLSSLVDQVSAPRGSGILRDGSAKPNVNYGLIYSILQLPATPADKTTASEISNLRSQPETLPLPLSAEFPTVPPLSASPRTPPGPEGATTNDPAPASQEAICSLLIEYLLKKKPLPVQFSALAGSNAQLAADYLEQISLVTHNARDWRRLRLFLVQLMASSKIIPEPYKLSQKVILEDTLANVVQGGYGAVYKGTLDGQVIAAKVARVARATPTSEDKTYAKELALWAHLDHPNILPLFGVATVLERPALISPWMKNGNLYDYVRKHRGCDRIALIVDVIKGLGYLHSVNIIHGDLKGPNVLISDEGRGMITDFGFSVTVVFSTRSTSDTRNCFTGRWAAPETLGISDGDPDRPTKAGDIWSFGCLMYEVLSRQLPYYRCRQYFSVVTALMRKQLPIRPNASDEIDIDEIEDDMWELMSKCWDFDPSQRPSCQDILKILGVPRDEASEAEDNLMHAFQRSRTSNEVDYERVHDLLKAIVSKEKQSAV